jgi:hypothetical protein
VPWQIKDAKDIQWCIKNKFHVKSYNNAAQEANPDNEGVAGADTNTGLNKDNSNVEVTVLQPPPKNRVVNVAHRVVNPLDPLLTSSTSTCRSQNPGMAILEKILAQALPCRICQQDMEHEAEWHQNNMQVTVVMDLQNRIWHLEDCLEHLTNRLQSKTCHADRAEDCLTHAEDRARHAEHLAYLTPYVHECYAPTRRGVRITGVHWSW